MGKQSSAITMYRVSSIELKKREQSLAQSIQQLTQREQQLELLNNYYSEYQQQFTQKNQSFNTVKSTHLQHNFLTKLSLALKEQRLSVNESKLDVSKFQQECIKSQLKIKQIKELMARQAQEEQIVLRRQEQKVLDDINISKVFGCIRKK